MNNKIDIIWNISQICPWDCKFCCTDATKVYIDNNLTVLNENNLSNSIFIKSTNIKRSNAFNIALQDKQSRGLELTFPEKINILNNLAENDVQIDFAGGDPLACSENFEVIKVASEKFGKKNISITSTGFFVGKYGIQQLSNIIGQYEFTFDENILLPSVSRPSGYNKSNILVASKFATNNIYTKAQLPIHQGNVKYEIIRDIYLTLCKSGIDELLLMRTFPVGRGIGYLEHNSLTKDQIKFVINTFKEFEQKIKGTKIKLQCALKYLEDNSDINPCDLMRSSYGINWRGDLLISAWANGVNGKALSDDFILGNISKEKFSEIINSEKAKRYREKLDLNFGHCKIFAYQNSLNKCEDAIFSNNDPLYL